MRFEALEDRSLLAGLLLSPPVDSTIEGFDNFDNIRNNAFSVIAPPDPHGAAGPTQVLNIGNNMIQWFKKDGTPQYSSSLRNFFAPAGAYTDTFDPKALYDERTGRFVVLTLELTTAANGDPADTSRFLLAVSDDSDPNGTWFYQSINSQFTIRGANGVPANYWTDYPGFAMDEEAIYLTGNIFPQGTGAAQGTRLWIIDKGLGRGGLYDGGLSAVKLLNPIGNPANRGDFTLQPASVFGGGQAPGEGAYLISYNGLNNGTADQLTVVRIDNPLGNTTFNVQTVSMGDVDDNSIVILPDAPQPAPFGIFSSPIDVGDRRVLSAVWRDNALWAVMTVIPPSGQDLGQSTTHWVKIDTSNPSALTLADQGDIGGEDIGGFVFTHHASVAVDGTGNAAFNFSASGPGVYSGSYYTTHFAGDAAGTVRKSRVFAEGQDAFDFDPLRNRWGDYSSITLDPSDGVTFWAFGEYAKASNLTAIRWGTRWGSFHINPPPPPPPPTPATPVTIKGAKWNDLDNDGVRDPNEKGLPGFTIYLDVDDDNALDIGEPAGVTDRFGNFQFSAALLGDYALREVQQPGWVQTFPGGPDEEHLLTLTTGAVIQRSFGNFGPSLDYGDAPLPYSTLLINNGARSPIMKGLHLGAPVIPPVITATPGVEADAETDGQPDANAQGDDATGADDEDGVTFPNTLVSGRIATASVVVSTGTNPGGYLNAWIDFNGDGDWNDVGEQIVRSKALPEGTNQIFFAIPASTALASDTFARFRYDFSPNVGPTGLGIAGEVEDYKVTILNDAPRANNDFFTGPLAVNQNSSNNALDVLANDVASSAGPLTLSGLGQTSSGGSVSIDGRGTPSPSDDVIRYSPLFGFVGTETFTYTVSDPSNRTSSALVTVEVVSSIVDPTALDDSFNVQPGTSTLDVLANDLPGVNGPISLLSVNNPVGNTGTALIQSGKIQFTVPAGAAAKDEQFTYSIVDSSSPTPKTSTATVSVHIGNSTVGDDVQFILQPTDLNGVPVSSVNPGQQFFLEVFVEDLRADDGDPSPPDLRGVFSAYMDLLYSSKLVGLAGTFEYAKDRPNHAIFLNQQSGDTTVAGVINELGGFQDLNPILGPGRLPLGRIKMNAITIGQAEFKTDPADILPAHETTLYQPSGTVGFPKITFGTATLPIGRPQDVFFKAIDDDFNVPAATTLALAVLNNDLPGLNGGVNGSSLLISTFTNPANGILQLAADARSFTYRPNNGFAGVDQFTYTIRDTQRNESTATVTLNVGNNTSDDLMQIRLDTTDLNGNPITSIQKGGTFYLQVYVTDLRPTDPRPSTPQDDRGVAASYLDVLYSFKNVSPLLVSAQQNPKGFDIVYGPNYTALTSGNATFPGLLDETGSFISTDAAGNSVPGPLGTGEFLLYRVTFTANATGTAIFTGDPRDLVPAHDNLLYEPPAAVSVNGVRIVNPTSPLVITTPAGGGGGEGSNTNPQNPLDVNADNQISPIDVLLVINFLNTFGPGLATRSPAPPYLDTNADGNVSALDALMVINFLNQSSGGEGEAFFEPFVVTARSAAANSASANGDVPVPSTAPRSVASTSALTSEAFAFPLGDLDGTNRRDKSELSSPLARATTAAPTGLTSAVLLAGPSDSAVGEYSVEPTSATNSALDRLLQDDGLLADIAAGWTSADASHKVCS